MIILYPFVIAYVLYVLTEWKNHDVGKCKLLLRKHSIKMSTVCVISKQLAFLLFHLMITSLRIQQNSKQFHITSALSFQFSAASKKTRALHFNTSRVRKRSLVTGGLKRFKRDTTVWFVRLLRGYVISHFVEHWPHCIYYNGEYCWIRLQWAHMWRFVWIYVTEMPCTP